jgi:hypothetical protein
MHSSSVGTTCPAHLIILDMIIKSHQISETVWQDEDLSLSLIR